MAKLADTRTLTGSQTIVGAFTTEASARQAIRVLERAGMPPDRIGTVQQNVRQAREVAGSYSPQGALAGAMLGAILVAAYVVFGGDAMRQSPVAIAVGGSAIIGGLAFIGWLGGRSRVLKEDDYAEAEDDIAAGETLVSVVCDTPDGGDETRAVLERAGATDIRVEASGESV